MAVPNREPAGQPEREEYRRPFVEQPRGPMGVVRSETPGYFDSVRWGPVFAGAFTALAIMMTLGFLGFAIGLSTVVPAGIATPAIWTILSMIIGLFVGGWIATATSGPTGLWDGVYHGTVVWGLTMILFALALGLGIGSLFGAFGIADTATLAAGAWGMFFASLLGLVSAILGGIVGSAGEAYRE